MLPQFIEITVSSSGKRRLINLMHVADISENRTGHAIIALAVEQENFAEGSRDGVIGQRVYVCEETYSDVRDALQFLGGETGPSIGNVAELAAAIRKHRADDDAMVRNLAQDIDHSRDFN